MSFEIYIRTFEGTPSLIAWVYFVFVFELIPNVQPKKAKGDTDLAYVIPWLVVFVSDCVWIDPKSTTFISKGNSEQMKVALGGSQLLP